MSGATDSLQGCISSVEYHRFNNPVKCVFECKNPAYKTYLGLHKHYLDKHSVCLHRVAHLDSNNEDEFRRQITSFFAPQAGGQVESQGYQSGHATPYANQPPAVSPSPQIAGPSHLRNYKTPGTTSHPTLASLGRESLTYSPSWYAGPTPIGSLPQNHSPGSILPVLGEVGPSRSIYPTTRHQPYPQSRPQQQGMYTDHSTARGQAKGKGREIPSTSTNHGLPAPNTPSQGNRLEFNPSATGPHNRAFMGSPQHPSVDAVYSRPQQTTTGTSIHPEWTLASRCPIDSIVPGNFRQPANTQDYTFPTDSPRGLECPIPASNAWHRHPQHQQLHATVAGSCNPTTYLPTPPVGTNSLPDGSACRPLQEQPSSLPWGINEERRPESRSPPAAKRLVSHPYPRPPNGSTTSRLARQAHENRQRGLSTEADAARKTFAHVTPPLEEGQARLVDVQYLETTSLLVDRQNYPADPQVELAPPCIHPPGRHAPSQSEEPTPVARATSCPGSATASPGQPRLRGSQPVNDIQSLDGPSTTLRGPGLPESCGSPRVQEPSDPAVSDPVERPQTAGESTPPTSVVQEPNQGPPPIRRHTSDKSHPTKAASEADGGLRRGGSPQKSFPEISWECWGLIKTPDGIYLPETFNPFPHELEDLTDQWAVGD